MVATPLRLRVPFPSPVMLSQEALSNMASVPEARGDSSTAYALVPLVVFISSVRTRSERNKMRRTYPIRGVKGISLGAGWYSKLLEYSNSVACNSGAKSEKHTLSALRQQRTLTHCWWHSGPVVAQGLQEFGPLDARHSSSNRCGPFAFEFWVKENNKSNTSTDNTPGQVGGRSRLCKFVARTERRVSRASIGIQQGTVRVYPITPTM